MSGAKILNWQLNLRSVYWSKIYGQQLKIDLNS